MNRWIAIFGLAATLGSVGGRGVEAQENTRAGLTRWVYPGYDAENYLRYLQTLEVVPKYPWSVRAFSPLDLQQLAPQVQNHPWATGGPLKQQTMQVGRIRVELAPVTADGWYNTAFPFGLNDGAVWVGRGFTGQVSAGVYATSGHVELTLAPISFWAENRRFQLAANKTPAAPFADPTFPTSVDRPQRFGDHSYGRVDWGQSRVALHALGVSAGVSSANEWWGPMTDFPFILGNNAPGFANVFIGTSHPIGVLVGQLHARLLYGEALQSAFSPETAGSGRRFVSGMVVALTPVWFPGLEIGASRFFHVAWPDSGLTSKYFTHMFESFLKQGVGTVFAPSRNDPKSSTDNQLASVFARWLLPHSGLELYGEYGREDHSSDIYDLVQEPDHAATYGLGTRKAWRVGNNIVAARIELMNFESSTLGRHRSEGGIYLHGYSRQGHTNRGQLLATAVAVGSGAAATVVLERFTGRGSSRVGWSRYVVREMPLDSRLTDVQHVIKVEHRRNAGQRQIETRMAALGVFDLNRDLLRDKINFRGEVGWAWWPSR